MSTYRPSGLPTPLVLALITSVVPLACKRTARAPLGDTGQARDTMAAPAATAPIPRNGGDTIAVPPAAVDTTTARAPGQAVGPGATGKATGVDTPITRRMGSPAPKKP